jgi:hypothetical protein
VRRKLALGRKIQITLLRGKKTGHRTGSGRAAESSASGRVA